jgi:hypothetical protein
MRKKQTSATRKIKRSGKDRRKIIAFEYFFNPEKERRKNIRDRRRELNRPKINFF